MGGKRRQGRESLHSDLSEEAIRRDEKDTEGHLYREERRRRDDDEDEGKNPNQVDVLLPPRHGVGANDAVAPESTTSSNRKSTDRRNKTSPEICYRIDQ